MPEAGFIVVFEGAATTEELSDVVLDFGVDSMPANSVWLRMASPVFNRMFQSGERNTTKHHQGSRSSTIY